jgi:CRISPR/Cas system-associated exonuclease Cas4 (RecB family)
MGRVMTDIPPNTSASQLVTYAICGRLYFYRYVLHVEPEFRSLNLALGSAVHSTIGWWFQERLQGQQPSIEAAEKIFAADIAAETVQMSIRWKDQTPDELEAKGQALVRTYLEQYGDLPVVGVEQRFEVDIEDADTGESLPRPLVGYFDLVVRKGDEIVEIKTTSKAWHPQSLLRHLQVGSYVTAANVLHGGPARIAIHAILKQKKPRVEEYPVERGEPDNAWFFHAAKAIEGAIQAGHFPPSPGTACFSCEYNKACLAECGAKVRQRQNLVRRAPQRSLPMSVHAA